MQFSSVHLIALIFLSAASGFANARPLHLRGSADVAVNNPIAYSEQLQLAPSPGSADAQPGPLHAVGCQSKLSARTNDDEDDELEQAALDAIAAQIGGTLARLRARTSASPSLDKIVRREVAKRTDESLLGNLLKEIPLGETIAKLPIVGKLAPKLPIVGSLLGEQKAASETASATVTSNDDTTRPNVRRTLLGGVLGDVIADIPVVNKLAPKLPVVGKMFGKADKKDSASPNPQARAVDENDETPSATTSPATSIPTAATAAETSMPSNTTLPARKVVEKRDGFEFVESALELATSLVLGRGVKMERREEGADVEEVKAKELLEDVLLNLAGGL